MSSRRDGCVASHADAPSTAALGASLSITTLVWASAPSRFASPRAESTARPPPGVTRDMLALVSTMIARARRLSMVARRSAERSNGCASATTAAAKIATRVASSNRSCKRVRRVGGSSEISMNRSDGNERLGALSRPRRWMRTGIAMAPSPSHAHGFCQITLNRRARSTQARSTPRVVRDAASSRGGRRSAACR